MTDEHTNTNKSSTIETQHKDKMPMERLPVFGICGYSGAGKTTLIEKLLPHLNGRGLKTAVVKHDAHGLDIDREGKDSDRFFKAGADVLVYGPQQALLRRHRSGKPELNQFIARHISSYDLILVEGHKFTPLPRKIWLLNDGEEKPPEEAEPLVKVLQRNAERVPVTLQLILAELGKLSRRSPVNAGILIGGRSSRMGRPKHLLKRGGVTWLEQALSIVSPLVDETVVLGAGDLPAAVKKTAIVLPDCREFGGPLAGMVSAMRWQPGTSWIFLACDLPLITASAVSWLLSQRAPGVRAVLPRQKSGQIEPLFAYYSFRMRSTLETLRRPQDAAADMQVLTPTVPAALAAAWKNVNTPAALTELAEAAERLHAGRQL